MPGRVEGIRGKALTLPLLEQLDEFALRDEIFHSGGLDARACKAGANRGA